MNVIHMFFNNKKKYIVLTRDDLFKWIKKRVLKLTDAKFVIRFLYKNVIYKHNYIKKLIMNKEFENKDVIKMLIKRYKI